MDFAGYYRYNEADLITGKVVITMVSSRYRRLAIAVCIGMLIVLLAGALVTNTESGRGCGDDWPLCNGKFVPAYTLESLIEYSHRLVTGVVGLIVVLLFIATRRSHRKSGEAVFYASGILFFTVLQALMGAAAVKWPQSSEVMALHFGISLLAFACTLLLVIWAYRHRDGAPVKPARVPRSVYPLTWFALLYCIGIVYIGAYIRHTDSSGGCLGWPLCNGEVVPELTGATGIVFIHRVVAIIMFIILVAMYYFIKRTTAPESGLVRASAWSVILVVTQVLSGALLTVTIGNEEVYIFTSLLHNLIICGLFGILSDMAIRSWLLRERKQ
ncbi:heme A synthase [Paenibacillus tarimensis]